MSAMINVRDSLCYKGTTLAVSRFKLCYGRVKNHLKTWAECNDLLDDEQNGVMSDRNCIGYLHSFTNITESRL